MRIKGKQDIDAGWMEEVKKTGARICPRIIFEEWDTPTLMQMLKNELILGQIAEAIVNLVLTNGFDGIVLEVFSITPEKYLYKVIHMLTHIADKLHQKNRKLILVIPPKSSAAQRAALTSDHFDKLKSFVDLFSLMTYDYSEPGKFAGMNSPLPWIEESVLALDPSGTSRNKILIGLNFYGKDVIGMKEVDHIFGDKYIEKIEKLEADRHKYDREPQVQWHAEAGEHIVMYKDEKGQGALIYPSMKSIQLRRDLAYNLGCGLAIWEVGQGLDYFYTLL